MRGFPCFMVHNRIGADPRLKRLTIPERWCFVAGVMGIASESHERGLLALSPTYPATVEDVAEFSGVSKATARSAVEKLVGLDVLSVDERGWLRVEDWAMWQPSPKYDVNGNRRQQLHRDPELRDLIRERDGGLCRYCGVEVNWTDRRGSLGGTYDHVDPIGENTPENLVVACRGCNARKSNRLPDEAGMDLLAPGSRSDLDRSQVGDLVRIDSGLNEVREAKEAKK